MSVQVCHHKCKMLDLSKLNRVVVCTVRQLLSSGVNPNAANSDSLTALHQVLAIDSLI